jgi:signal transduction histidine kinase/CheY-like chemotaxis protein
MRRLLNTGLHSFRGRIVFSFVLIASLFLLWTILYFTLSRRRDAVLEFSNSITELHNQTLRDNFLLQTFIVSGYQQPEFYGDSKNSDIERFINNQEQTNQKINLITNSKGPISNDFKESLDELWERNNMLIDSVRVMRNVYLLRGFKDYGAEGAMRGYAHMLQESSIVKEADIYKLRRHEKDFLLRNDTSYVTKFRNLLATTLKDYPAGGPAYNALLSYEHRFLELVNFNLMLGVGMEAGLYESVQSNMQRLNAQFIEINASIGNRYVAIDSNFNRLLLIISLLTLALLIFLTFFLSDILTRDIKNLNERVFSFINSRFRDMDQGQDFSPSIQEVDQLNRQFLLLKKNLTLTIGDLQDSYEKAKKVSEFKTFFLANMSHEIRTPLNGVVGMLQVMKRTQLDESQKEYLSTIEYSAKHLMELVNMVLDYSKIEAGKMELLELPFNLEKELQMLSKSFHQTIKDKGLNLDLTIDLDSDVEYLGDAVRLHQVLINILNNAVKFSEKGTIRLRVITIERTDENIDLLFEVADEGVGMDKEQLENLFVAFEQGGKGYSRKYGGTGLGLVISQEIIKMMGGLIKVKSTAGKGSVFSFKLSLKVAPKSKFNFEENKVYNSKNDSLKILLAEDNQINQRVLELMMQPWSIDLDIVDNGRDAVEAYFENDFDLILMDIQMPSLDGYEACRMIKESSKYKSRRIGVIALTANAFNEDRVLAKEAGFDGFISKPVNLKELESLINKYRVLVQSEREDWR